MSHAPIDDTSLPFPPVPDGWEPSHLTRDIASQLERQTLRRVAEVAAKLSVPERAAAELVLGELRGVTIDAQAIGAAKVRAAAAEERCRALAEERADLAATLRRAMALLEATDRARVEALSQAQLAQTWGAEALVERDMAVSIGADRAHTLAVGQQVLEWFRDLGDIDIAVRGKDMTVRPKTWRLALALRLSVLEAEREQAVAMGYDFSDACERAEALLRHAMIELAKESHGRRNAEESAAKGWGVYEAEKRRREQLHDEVSDAKERLAKLTGAVFVHGPSLADHVERVRKMLTPMPGDVLVTRMVGADRGEMGRVEDPIGAVMPAPPARPAAEPRHAQHRCLRCGAGMWSPSTHVCASDRTGVVVEEDDGDAG